MVGLPGCGLCFCGVVVGGIEKIRFEEAAQDVLSQVTGKSFGTGAPERDAAFPVEEIHAEGKGFEYGAEDFVIGRIHAQTLLRKDQRHVVSHCGGWAEW